MKLEIGQFIRFKDKRGIEYIRKITSVNNTYPDKLYAGIYIDKEANNSNGVSIKNIIKASFDKTDLIEVGDVIKYRIDKVYLETKGYLTGVTNIADEEMIENIKENKNYHVLQILTKEQFEQMSYKAGE